MTINSLSSQLHSLTNVGVHSIKTPPTGPSAKLGGYDLKSIVPKVTQFPSEIMANAQQELSRLSLQRSSALTDREFRLGASEAIMKVLHLDNAIAEVNNTLAVAKAKLPAEAIVQQAKLHSDQFVKNISIASKAF